MLNSPVISVVPRSKDAAGVNICHLAELDSETLYLYGPGSLDALDRNWGSQAVSSVCTISFKFIDFDNIVPHFHKISVRFPSLAVRLFCISFDPNSLPKANLTKN